MAERSARRVSCGLLALALALGAGTGQADSPADRGPVTLRLCLADLPAERAAVSLLARFLSTAKLEAVGATACGRGRAPELVGRFEDRRGQLVFVVRARSGGTLERPVPWIAPGRAALAALSEADRISEFSILVDGLLAEYRSDPPAREAPPLQVHATARPSSPRPPPPAPEPAASPAARPPLPALPALPGASAAVVPDTSAADTAVPVVPAAAGVPRTSAAALPPAAVPPAAVPDTSAAAVPDTSAAAVPDTSAAVVPAAVVPDTSAADTSAATLAAVVPDAPAQPAPAAAVAGARPSPGRAAAGGEVSVAGWVGWTWRAPGPAAPYAGASLAWRWLFVRAGGEPEAAWSLAGRPVALSALVAEAGARVPLVGRGRFRLDGVATLLVERIVLRRQDVPDAAAHGYFEAGAALGGLAVFAPRPWLRLAMGVDAGFRPTRRQIDVPDGPSATLDTWSLRGISGIGLAW